MRLLGLIGGEEAARAFASFLSREGIQSLYFPDASGRFAIWIVEEDDVEMAQHWFREYEENPEDLQFQSEHPLDAMRDVDDRSTSSRSKMDGVPASGFLRGRLSSLITQLMISICVVFYVVNHLQLKELEGRYPQPYLNRFTPIFTTCIYDIPADIHPLLQFFQRHPKLMEGDPAISSSEEEELKRIEAIPTWKGLYAIALTWPRASGDRRLPPFRKIVEGEFWRLFTPVFLHGSFLHILFNMLWLWLLGKQVEERVRRGRYLLLLLLIGVTSNACQYIVSGPLFIGSSGIVCGLAGFIWMRQRLAPWEGYPLAYSSLVFLGIFIIAIFGMQVVSFFLTRFHFLDSSMHFANGAHIAGATAGIALARIPFFSREPS